MSTVPVDDMAVADSESKTQMQAEHSDSCEKGVDPNEVNMTPEEEARMVRKMDLNIFPILICLYILSFLDRVNIGKN
jgi:hypothetical protein